MLTDKEMMSEIERVNMCLDESIMAHRQFRENVAKILGVDTLKYADTKDLEIEIVNTLQMVIA